jgi:hypothetical protein
VSNPRNQPIPEATKQLVEKLLLERMSLRAITRVAGVSLQWVQSYVNSKSRTVEQKVKVIPKKKCVSLLNVMNYGLLLAIKNIRCGCG